MYKIDTSTKYTKLIKFTKSRENSIAIIGDAIGIIKNCKHNFTGVFSCNSFIGYSSIPSTIKLILKNMKSSYERWLILAKHVKTPNIDLSKMSIEDLTKLKNEIANSGNQVSNNIKLNFNPVVNELNSEADVNNEYGKRKVFTNGNTNGSFIPTELASELPIYEGGHQ